VVVPTHGPNDAGGVASLEMATRLTADADAAQRTFHFRLGSPRSARTVRVARDLLLDIDDRNHLSGLWLLNVPACPTEARHDEPWPNET
jgi:hypothetical protein